MLRERKLCSFLRSKTKNQPTKNPEKKCTYPKERGRKKAEKTSFMMIAITLPHTFYDGTYLIALSLHENGIQAHIQVQFFLQESSFDIYFILN